ncbi:MAG: O-antigen ligase family protein [Bacteroides sp.]|nr:O-antigen ligase family protein [Bacteroides sp.]
MATNVMFAITYCIQKKGNTNNTPFFFKTSFVFILLSFSATAFYHTLNIPSLIFGLPMNMIADMVFLVMLQKAIKTLRDIRILFNCIAIISVLMVTLGLYESIMHDNPFLDWVYQSVPFGAIKEFRLMYYIPPWLSASGDLDLRYGVVRVYSFFSIHIAFGVTCTVFLYLCLFFLMQKEFIDKRKILISLIILLTLGVFLSNSKAPLLGLVAFYLSFFTIKRLFNGNTVLLLLLLIVVLLYYFPSYLTNIIALYNSKIASDGGGSDMNLRQSQFAMAFILFAQHPIFGNGVDIFNNLSESVTNIIKGAESSWMQIGITRGVLGIIAYIYLYDKSFRKLRKCLGKRRTLGLCIGLGLMETATGQLNLVLIGGVMIVINCFFQVRSQSCPVQ